ncbi:MAG: hypothetical protein V4635_16005 [Bacteroidota bacterium]
MKTTLLYILLVLTTATFAQSAADPMELNQSVQPPTIVMTTFTSNYHTRALWTANEDNTFNGSYVDESTNMGRVIIYDERGNLVAVENELHNNAYPVAIATWYIKNYPKEKFTIWSHYDTNDSKTYFANRSQETIWFDRNGTYTHTVKKSSQLITKKS